MPERFSASSAARHMACHASANLELAIPNYVPPVEDRTIVNASNIGTRRHEQFAIDMELPAKDIEAYARALQYVAELRSKRRFKVLIEEGVSADWLPTPTKTTVDLALYTQDELHILDLKWGKILVDVVENEQLLFYAACFAHLAPKAKGVHLHILQPRADNMATWFVDTTRLREFMDEAAAAQAKILAGDTSFGPSDHCKFCPANPHTRGLKGKPLCPAMMQMLYPTVLDESDILSL